MTKPLPKGLIPNPRPPGTSLAVVEEGEKLRIGVREWTVRAACNNSTGGQWYCATHHCSFHNQFDKDTHIDEPKSGAHALVWLCHEHGPEVP